MNNGQYPLGLYNVPVIYMKFLHGFDYRVQYSETKNYSYKPFWGPLSLYGEKYFIPLSSAKNKHISMDYEGDMHFLIHETISKADKTSSDIIKGYSGDDLEKILAILHINNMIPVPDGCYKPITTYTQLLQKEYRFCVNIHTLIIEKAENIYSGKIRNYLTKKLCCDFVNLENAKNKYQFYSNK